GGLLGTSLNLDSTKGLNALTVGVNNGGILNVTGGSLVAGTLNVDGTAGGARLTMTGGTISTRNLNGSGGGVAAFGGSPINLTLAGAVAVTGASSQFKIDQGATFTSTSLNTSGQVIVGTNADFIVQNSVTNNGVITVSVGGLDVRG